MKKAIFLFLIVSASLLAQPKGSWRQVFPEENGEIPGARYDHYMCPIGDQQVLMLGGLGGGNPHYYNECWLYDYKINKWNKLNLDTIPNTYQATAITGDFLFQISKNRAIIRSHVYVEPSNAEGRIYIFDLDSLKWLWLSKIKLYHYWELGYNEDVFPASLLRNSLYLEDNLIFDYIFYNDSNGRRRSAYLIQMHPNEPFDSPNFLTKKLINDERETKQGPYFNYRLLFENNNLEKQFVLNKNNTDLFTFVPAWGGEQAHSFMTMERYIYKWMFLQEGKDTLPAGFKRKYADLTKNMTLIMHDTNTYILQYSPETNLMNTYKIASPSSKVRNAKMAKISDGRVMLFGGMRTDKLSNDTWIFELDCIGIKDNFDEDVKIFTLDNNIYLLDKEMKNAALYDVIGRKIMEIQGTELNLNHLSVGMYFLQYTENNLQKVIKLLKK